MIHQIDVKITFLNGDLEEGIYMTQPKGVCDGKLGLGTIVYLEEAFLRRVWENVFFLIKTLLIFQEREV